MSQLELAIAKTRDNIILRLTPIVHIMKKVHGCTILSTYISVIDTKSNKEEHGRDPESKAEDNPQNGHHCPPLPGKELDHKEDGSYSCIYVIVPIEVSYPSPWQRGSPPPVRLRERERGRERERERGGGREKCIKF